MKDNDKILSIKENFPEETMLVGIILGDKVILAEGMHRVCVLAS